MSLTIHPDPQEPAGGYAFLELPGGSLGTGPVGVAVMETYGARWLGPSDDAGGRTAVGAANWQGERHDFGPYAVHAHDGADWVKIGPEIVNKIEEYTPLRLVVDGQSADVTWPDNVPPRAGAAVLGGLLPTRPATTRDTGAALVGKPQEPEIEPVQEPEPAPEPPQTVASDEPAPPNRRAWWLLLVAVALIGALVALWWFYLRDTPDEQVKIMPEAACTNQALAALDGFAAMEIAIRACGDALSADTVLAIVEDAAGRGDPDALLLFGTLYDGAEEDTQIEKVIGLTFADDAARAAEYYARAAGAGSDTAGERLKVTCVQLAGSDKTLAKGAYDDYCD